MNENLNLVEILKDCPKGTKLYSTLFGEVLYNDTYNNHHIRFSSNSGDLYYVFNDGRYYDNEDGECILFPSRDQRDWNKFIPVIYKNGNILIDSMGSCFICNGKYSRKIPCARCGVTSVGLFVSNPDGNNGWTDRPVRLATKDEEAVFFTQMFEAGYGWDAKTKTLYKEYPINTPMMVYSEHDGQWLLAYYAGNKKVYKNSKRQEDLPTSSTCAYTIMVPIKDFDFKASTTENIAKAEH